MTDSSWPSHVAAMTLFTEDLDASAEFYQILLQADPIFRNDDSVVFRAGTTLVNLLHVEAVPALIDPAGIGRGARAVYTLGVEYVDAEEARLSGEGVEILNGPQDRPWGIRTLSVSDPSGHIWELAK